MLWKQTTTEEWRDVIAQDLQKLHSRDKMDFIKSTGSISFIGNTSKNRAEWLSVFSPEFHHSGITLPGVGYETGKAFT